MAGNTVDVNLKIRSNTKEETAEMKKLNAEKNKLEKPAAKSKMGGTAPRGRRRKVMDDGGREESRDYGRARAAVGTGAASRDFAQQAEGLGGLVRLYATYAANVFAVSAAFTALSNAMNTTNMVEGLNQLGASSGRALGTVAKQFEKATGYAISFRDSIEAVTKGAAGNLSNNQILKLGELGTKAASVLGVNTTDAISRLTRAVTKLEPELLDELGIVARLDPAMEEYARALGKPVSALTTLERQQAFTLAVTKDLENKYGDINIPTSPYDKLLASLKNITAAGLELVNKVLTPLVSLLSESPAALTGILVALGAKVVSQAIPALTNYRNQIKSTAEEAKNLFTSKQATAKDVAATRAAAARNKLELAAEDATTKLVQAEKRFEQVSAKAGTLGNRAISDLLARKGDPADFTKKDLELIRQIGAAQKDNAQVYKELEVAIRGAQKANQDFLKEDARLKRQEAKPSMFSPEGLAAANAKRAERRAASLDIISKAGDAVSTEGIVGSFKNLNKQVSSSKLGVLTGTFTRIAGTVNIAAGALSAFSAIISRVFVVVGIFITAYQVLDSIFSKNKKELEAFNETLELNKTATENAERTAKKWEDVLSIQSILARNNALKEQALQVEVLAQKYAAARTASLGFWDSLGQGILSLFGKDIASKTAEGLADSVLAAVANVSKGKRKEAEASLLTLLGIKDLNKDAIKKAIIKSGSVTQVSSFINNLSKDSEVTAGAVSGIEQALNETQKEFGDFSNSLKDTSKTGIFFEKVTKSIFELNKGLSGTDEAKLATIKNLASNMDKLEGLSPDALASLKDAVKFIQDYSGKLDEEERKKRVVEVELKTATTPELQKLKTEQLQQVQNTINIIRDAQVRAFDRINAALSSGLSDAVNRLSEKVAIEAEKGRIGLAQGIVGLLPKNELSVAITAKLEQEKLNLQRREIESQYALVNAITLDRLSREKENTQQKLEKASEADKGALRTRLKEIDAELLAVRSPTQYKQELDRSKQGTPTGPFVPGSAKAQEYTERNTPMIFSEKSLELYRQGISKAAATVGLGAQEALIQVRGFVEARQEAAKAALEMERSRVAELKEQNKLREESPGIQNLDEGQRSRAIQELRAEVTRAESRLAEEEARIQQQMVADITAQAKKLRGILGSATVQDIERSAALSAQRLGQKEESRQRVVGVGLQTEEVRTSREAQKRELEAQFSLAKISTDTEIQAARQLLTEKDAVLSAEENRVNILSQLGRLGVEEELIIKRQNEERRNALELEKSLFEATSKFRDSELEINKQIATASTEGEIDRATAQSALNRQEMNDAISTARQRAAVRSEEISQIFSVSKAQQDYTNLFKGSFEQMGDAIAEFAMTGKLNFKGLVDSMIADFIRMTLRMQMQKLVGAGAPGDAGFVGFLGKAFGSFFGPSIGGATLPQANGGAWDMGVQKFGKGGMFTNSIVHSPTMFKFAKGTGLMGEAGPEAIMPLTRDGSGRLGVSAQTSSPTVDVVVNNFSNQTATTKETKDSRGNRRIEVIVGDMNAAEMSRPGSSSQQTLKNNFGLQPTLTRR